MKKPPNFEAQHQTLQAQYEQLRRALEQKEAELLAKEQRIIEQKAQIEYLTERLNILLAKRFKAQSEQLKYLQGQLFDEAELGQAIRETQEALEALKQPGPADRPAPSSPAEPAAKPKRKPLPDHLRRVEVIVDVSDEDKQAMGEDWCCIGYESSEQLAVQQHLLSGRKRQDQRLRAVVVSEHAV